MLNVCCKLHSFLSDVYAMTKTLQFVMRHNKTLGLRVEIEKHPHAVNVFSIFISNLHVSKPLTFIRRAFPTLQNKGMPITHFLFINEWEWNECWVKPEIKIVEIVDCSLFYNIILCQMIIANVDMKMCLWNFATNDFCITYKITYCVLILQSYC